MFYKVNLNSNHSLSSEFPSASTKVRKIELRPFEVSRCRTSQVATCFLPGEVRMWNDHPYTVLDIGTLNGFKDAVDRLLLP